MKDTKESLVEILDEFVRQRGGRNFSYSDDNCQVSLPLEGDRYQSVTVIEMERDGNAILDIRSVIGNSMRAKDKIDYILNEMDNYILPRFLFDDGYAKLNTRLIAKYTTKSFLLDAIEETACAADDFEKLLSDEDIN